MAPERSDPTRSFVANLGLERTIKKPDENAKLKSLAGIITSLTYTEMTSFSGRLNAKINNGTSEIPEILLDIANEILKDK